MAPKFNPFVNDLQGVPASVDTFQFVDNNADIVILTSVCTNRRLRLGQDTIQLKVEKDRGIEVEATAELVLITEKYTRVQTVKLSKS